MNNKRNIKNNNTLSDNQKRTLILEKRLARLENLIKNEDAYDDIDFESCRRRSRKQVKHESANNSYDICREILDHYDASDWIGVRDIDEYLNNYYSDMSDEDRWFVHDRMEKFVDVDNYRSVQDDDEDDDEWEDEDDDEYDESLKRRLARLEKFIKNEIFDDYREIETEEDILDLLSPSTRRMFKRLDPVYQEHALDLLSQRVDWNTEDAEEIDAAMRSIIRYL